jgi:UDP-GlcNAc:undecaprenyl-phosphate GlcNAc-1-phosphate transferase
MQLFLGLACAFILSALSMPLILRFAHRKKLYDPIDDRKLHTGNIPRLGGVGIFLSFLATIVLVTLLTGHGASTGGKFWVVLFTMFIVHLVGLADDFMNIRARYKLILELFAAVLLAAMGFRFVSITLPFGLGVLDLGTMAYPLTILWLTGVPNALNLIDGMDGLAGGIAAFIAAAFGAFFLFSGDTGAALACFALVGAILGFLVFNRPPAKIFMGDSGALFLGFAIAVLPLISAGSGRTEIGFLPAATLLVIPIFDTFAAIIRRIRMGSSVFSPDKLHLHHKLLALGFSVRGTLAIIYAAQALLCAVALSAFIFSPSQGSFIMLATWCLYALLFLVLDRVANRRVSQTM